MFKKIIFALIILIIAISSVSATDINSTCDEYSNFNMISNNISDVSLTEFDDVGLADTDSDALAAAKTVYFDASASTDGSGTKSNPYKYLYSGRITSGMTAYFANGVYSFSGTGKIGYNSLYKTTFIGQSKDKTIIRSTASYSFDLIVSSNSNLVLKDLTFDYGHIVNSGNVEAENVIFKNSVCSYTSTSSSVGSYSCGGVIYSNASKGSTCSINLKNCNFQSNEAKHGGVISANYTNIVITNCVFQNSISNRSGGAIYSLNSNITISKSSFTRNNAKYGGAIYSEKGIIKLIDSNFTSSQAYSFGGVIASQLSNISSSNCIFYNYNSLTDSGGAIYSDRGSVDISKSTFKNGVADFGGAICVLNVGLTVSNSNFQNNTANYGGAIYNIYKTVYIYNTNFKSSTAYLYGGAVCSYLADSITIKNSVFVSSDDMYIFAKSTTKIVQSGNSGLTNVKTVNTTILTVSPNVVAPIINYSPSSQNSIPSYYNSNDYGYVTPVKNQMDGGNCWAFAAIATLEICLKKATGITYDFSEENIKNLMSIYSLVGRDQYPNKGGLDNMVFGYLTSWLGPINDNLDVYDDYSALSTIYSSLLHIQNIYFLPVRADTSDNNAIKKAIMDYGAVAASYAWTTSYHSVTLVGWNDNYNAKDYFGNYAKGVWIVKNSWGSDSDDNGYVYISYDKNFKYESSNYHNYLYTFIFNDAEGYSRNYQYDLNSVNYYETSSSNGVKYKNTFVAQDNEILSAFSTVFKEPTSYKVSLYKGNTLILTQQGYSQAGYYTIPFNTKTTLSKGDQFTICIENLNSGKKFIPLSDASYSNLGNFPKGVSYISFGSSWYDLYSHYSKPKIACIKAFTTPLTLNEVTLSIDKFTNVYVNEKLTINFKLSNSNLNRGFVTVNIGDKTYYASVYGGKASLKISFNAIGSYNFKAQYKNNLYASNTVSFNFNVIKTAGVISISAPDVTSYYGRSTKFSIRLTDDGQPINGAVVSYTCGSFSTTATTNSNGYAYVYVNLSPGTYDVTSQYGGKSVKSKITVKSTISASDLTYDYGSSYIKATFYNTAGGVLSNTQVKFQTGILTYTVTTNSNGVAVVKFDRNASTYGVIAINPVNNEEKSFKVTVSKVTPILTLKQITLDGYDAVRASLSQTSATGNIVFTFEDTDYSTGISEGISNLKIINRNGIYDVTVKYSGDANFNPVSKSISVNVGSYLASISVSGITKTYGDSKQLVITVRDNHGNPVKDNFISVDVYDDDLEFYDSYYLWTNSKGQVKLNCNFKPGTYSLDVSNDDDYINVDVVVKKAASKLTAANRIVNAKSKIKTYTIVLKNNKNKVLKNQKVTLRVGGVTYVAKTNGYGKAIFKITKLNRKGTFKAIVSYAGNSYYKKISKIVRFYVR